MAKPLVVFTYAPTGLGHIRVTDALHDGLPDSFDSVVFAPNDPSIEFIHRLISINVLLMLFHLILVIRQAALKYW